ncbi:MAG: hypothetical protein ACYDEJ_02265 [Desulfitobacteriaceae bacterium]
MDYQKMWNDLRKYVSDKVDEFKALDRESSYYIDILKQMDTKVVATERIKYLDTGFIIPTEGTMDCKK